MSSTDTAAPALKEIFNAERLQHIADEMSAVYRRSRPGPFSNTPRTDSLNYQ